jgi:hypothetical protein
MRHKRSVIVAVLGLMLSLALTTWADHKVSMMEKVVATSSV